MFCASHSSSASFFFSALHQSWCHTTLLGPLNHKKDLKQTYKQANVDRKYWAHHLRRARKGEALDVGRDHVDPPAPQLNASALPLTCVTHEHTYKYTHACQRTQSACNETEESACIMMKYIARYFTAGKARDSLCGDRLGARVSVDQALVVLLRHTSKNSIRQPCRQVSADARRIGIATSLIGFNTTQSRIHYSKQLTTECTQVARLKANKTVHAPGDHPCGRGMRRCAQTPAECNALNFRHPHLKILKRRVPERKQAAEHPTHASAQQNRLLTCCTVSLKGSTVLLRRCHSTTRCTHRMMALECVQTEFVAHNKCSKCGTQL